MDTNTTSQEGQAPTEQAPASTEGVVQQFQPHDAAAQGPGVSYDDRGWSWGAAMLWPQFVIATRKYVWLLLIILLAIPVVNLFAMVILFIVFGLKGRELAADSRTFSNKDEYLGFMKGIDHAGKVMFFISLVLIVIVGTLSVVVLSSLSATQQRALEASLRHEEQQLQFQQELEAMEASDIGSYYE